jgi:hypothetical protein
MHDMARKEEVGAVVDWYRKHHPRARPDKKERLLIGERLADGYSVEDLCQAIDGCHLSSFHCGQNDRHTKYQSLGLIMRSSSHVLKFIEIYEREAAKRHREEKEKQERYEELLRWRKARGM